MQKSTKLKIREKQENILKIVYILVTLSIILIVLFFLFLFQRFHFVQGLSKFEFAPTHKISHSLPTVSQKKINGKNTRKQSTFSNYDSFVRNIESEIFSNAFLDFKCVSKSQNLDDFEKTRLNHQKDYDARYKHTKTFQYLLSKNYNTFPIILLCYNRANYLRQTLDSLLSLKEMNKNQLLIVQNDNIYEVSELIKSMNLNFVQHMSTSKDGAERISDHYLFALESGFKYFNDAPGLIVIEDDFLFSPDFLEYFNYVAPVVESDESIFTASAYNDNGFKDIAMNKTRILRTDFFPGLGWFCLRSLWKRLKPIWPSEHWDWFMRDPKVNKLKDILYPEVPRIFHNGKKGTFMSSSLQEKYFDRIAYNINETFRWNKKDFLRLNEKEYDLDIEQSLKNGIHITDTSHFLKLRNQKLKSAIVIWYSVNPLLKKEKLIYTDKLGLWNEIMRGQKDGMLNFWYKDNKIVLINIYSKNRKESSKFQRQIINKDRWKKFRPKNSAIFTNKKLGALFVE